MPKCSRQGLHLKSARIAKLAKQKVNSVELSSLDSEGDFEGCESYCFDDHLVDEEVINAALFFHLKWTDALSKKREFYTGYSAATRWRRADEANAF